VLLELHVDDDVTTWVVPSESVAVATSWLVGLAAPSAVVPVMASDVVVAVVVVAVVVPLAGAVVVDDPLQAIAARSGSISHACFQAWQF
jgi:hypothetical protein